MKILGNAIKMTAIAIWLGGIWWGWPFFQVILTGEAPLGPIWLVNWGAAPQAFLNYVAAMFCLLPGLILWTLGAVLVARADGP
jgi:hypothetical protein